MKTPTIPDLEAQAAAIARAGANEDTAIQLLAKGGMDAVAALRDVTMRLLDLHKGGKGGDEQDEPTDEDENQDPDAEGGEGEGGGEGGGAPGYADMGKGRPGPLTGGEPMTAGASDQQHLLDVSRYVFETGAMIRDLVASNAEMRKAIDASRAENAILREGQAILADAVRQASEAQLAVAIPLAKAVAETRSALLNTAVPSLTPAVRIPLPPVTDAAYLGGSRDDERRLLAKAQARGVIDFGHLQLFQRERRFAVADTDNDAIRSKVEALQSA